LLQLKGPSNKLANTSNTSTTSNPSNLQREEINLQPLAGTSNKLANTSSTSNPSNPSNLQREENHLEALEGTSNQLANTSSTSNPSNLQREEKHLQALEGPSDQIANASSTSNPINLGTNTLDESNPQLLEGQSSRLVNTNNSSNTNSTSYTKDTKTNTEKLNPLQNVSIENSFNHLNNSMFQNLNVVVHTSDNCNSCSNHEHCQAHPKPHVDVIDVSEIVRRKAETKAAITSLITNSVLGLSMIAILIHATLTSLFDGSETANYILVILFKGMIPFVTGIANFVKVQEVLILYWNQFNTFSFLK
jgi:hypothetical protein